MGKHTARKMTKAERKNHEEFYGRDNNHKLRIRSVGDLIMLPLLAVMALPLLPFTIGMAFFTLTDKIFRRR